MSPLLARAARPVVDSLEGRRLMAAGSLDPTFGTGGIVRTGVRGDVSQLRVVFGPSNNMLTSGYDPRGGSGATNVVRLTDVTGTSTREIASYSISLSGVTSIGFAADGKILITGTKYNDYGVNGYGFVDVFSPAGERVIRLATGRSINAVAQSVDGDYYATGYLTDPADGEGKNGIARFNPDGTLDKTFDGDGLAFTSMTTINQVFAQPSGGGVIVGGSDGDGAVLRRYLPIGLPAETFYKSADPARNPVMTKGGQIAFQHLNTDGSTELRVTSLSDADGVPITGDSLTSRAAGGPIALVANKDGVVSLTQTPGEADLGNATIKQYDKIGAAPVLQAIVGFGAGYGVSAGTSGDKLAVSQVIGNASGDVSVYEARVDLQPAVTPPVVGTAKIGGVVFDDANGSTWRDSNELGVVGRQVFIDANNNGMLDTGEKIAVTDAGGYYEFTGLTTGKYVVRLGISLGGDATTFANGQTITISKDGEYVFAGDFGQKAIGNPNTNSNPTQPPVAVTGTKAVLTTVGKKKVVRLTWAASTTAGATYRIERRYRGETTWGSVATLGANVKTFDDASILKGVVYEYRIVAINPAGSWAGGVVSIKT